MKTRKISAILIAITFLFVAIASCVMLFSVKEVRVNYAVADDADTFSVQKKFDAFIGESLVFFDVKKVYAVVDDPVYEVVSVYKQFPNVLNVKIQQRREVYKFLNGGKVYTLDSKGVVFLSEEYVGGEISTRENIELEFVNVNVSSLVLGEGLVTSDDLLFNTVLEMAEKVDLTDRIKKIRIVNVFADGSDSVIAMRNAEFYTYTGVSIVIENAFEYGVERISAAVSAYDNAHDYVKTFDTIKAVRNKESGEVNVIFTSGYDN